jgi:starvation-inducible outer membrane lipoprotein
VLSAIRVWFFNLIFQRVFVMKNITSLSVLAAFCLSLAACATVPAPAPDLTPPKERLDAKTQLEYGKAPRASRS